MTNTLDYLIIGKTVSIMKDREKGNVTHLRSITSLPLMWKIFNGILRNKLYDHLESETLRGWEQRTN